MSTGASPLDEAAPHEASDQSREAVPKIRTRRLQHYHALFWGASFLVCGLAFGDVIFLGRSFLAAGRIAGTYSEPPFIAGYAARGVGRAEFDAGAETWQTHPFAYEERRALSSGRLPLWNSHNGLGTPLLSNGQASIFNPLHLLVLLDPDAPWLWDLHFVLLRFIAAIFGCYLLKRLGVRTELCLLGAPLGALHGVVTSFGSRGDVEAYALMPAVLYCITCARESPTIARGILLALALALCAVAGQPEAAFACLVIAGTFALALTALPSGGRLRYLVLCAGAAGVGALLSAPYALPMLARIDDSFSLHPPGVGRFWKAPVLLLQWLVPGCFSSSSMFETLEHPWENLGYLGGILSFLAVAAAVTAAAVPAARVRLLFLAGPIILIGKMYGFPGFGWIGRLPLFTRMPIELYFQFPVLYCLGLAGIVAVSALAAIGPWRRAAVLGVSALAIVEILLLAPVLVRPGPDAPSLSTAWPLQGLVYANLAIGAAAAAWVAGSTRARWRWVASLLLLVSTTLELRMYRHRFSVRGNPTGPAPYVDWLKRQQATQPAFRVIGMGQTLMPNFATAYGLDDVRLTDALMSRRYVQFIQRFLQPKLTWEWFFSAEPATGFDPDNPILNWINVRYLVSSRQLLGTPTTLQRELLKDGRRSWRGWDFRAYDIDGESLPVLYQHPDDEGTTTVTVPRETPVLAFALAQDPFVWDKPGAGTTFSILVREPGEAPRVLFSRLMDPKHVAEDRHWLRERVDLSAWKGRSVSLTLRATSSNGAWCWGGWGDLHWESLSGVRDVHETPRDLRARVVYRDRVGPPTVVLENDRAWPRAFLAGEPILENDGESVLARIDALKANPEPVAVMESDFPRAEWSHLCAAHGCRPGIAGDVQDLRFAPNEVHLRTDAARPSVLVLGDLHAPGWRAFVDGKEQPILAANYLLRGLVLTPGRHEVRFRYWPREWTLAFAMAAAGWLAVGACAWRVTSRRKVSREIPEDPPRSAPAG